MDIFNKKKVKQLEEKVWYYKNLLEQCEELCKPEIWLYVDREDLYDKIENSQQPTFTKQELLQLFDNL